MELGETHNDEARRWGRPLDGVRVLALEQMQALPFATQLLARLGADVVKVEPPGRGDSGRASAPAIERPNGESVGATFLRNNLDKRSITIDVGSASGHRLALELAAKADVVCENLGPGRAAKAGLAYDDVRQVNPRVVYLSISGFGNLEPSPYADWPAYAAVAEAMSGIYDYARLPHQPPVINPLGGIGDTGTALYALIGLLAALRHRDRMGEGQYVDVAMYDAMLSLCDLSYNYWSLGLVRDPDQPRRLPLILDSFQASDGWVVLQVGRPHQFERLAGILGHPEWLGDDRFADGGWVDQFEPVIRPALDRWASGRSMLEAAAVLAEAGLAAAPCYTGAQVAEDEHVRLHRMVVEIPRTDGVDQPVLVAGNPIKMTKVAEGPDRPMPMLGEHTDEVLAEWLGLDGDRRAALREQGALGR
ncbi:MAG: CaiB/BaiF CoA transferase family protein [Acidimicrobiales bacterium]